MRSLDRRKTWFIVALLVLAGGHAAFYRVPNILNDHGRAWPEWPLLVDIVVTLPALYWLLLRPALKRLPARLLACCAGGLLFGSAVVPPAAKDLWHTFEDNWLLMPALQIGLEAWLVLALVGRVRALVRTSGNVDEALASELTTRFGKLAPAFLFEARAWYYGLILRDGAALRFRGDRHFTYHANQGNASTQAAFIFVLLIELPLVHLLLHFVAPAPWMAWAADGLQLWTLLYLIAEYRATRWRPVSLDGATLLLRYGVLAADQAIPLSSIVAIDRCGNDVRRRRGVMRLRQCGALNVALTLQAGMRLPGLLGPLRPVHQIYLGLDDPEGFIAAVRARQAPARVEQ
ncbi:hypothetical protein [Massilia sp. YMA4]|uniref:hypothetical protein n=1 Tax=Massilia sp. YMA4 TaxID=1593482 RepID=UPI000DD11786|nr:hypothetical protein [Massilia sp. YMA4]AXA91707.1 hypothetical protein DPH57_11425 [Massilia sp. YMA4]